MGTGVTAANHFLPCRRSTALCARRRSSRRGCASGSKAAVAQESSRHRLNRKVGPENYAWQRRLSRHSSLGCGYRHAPRRARARRRQSSDATREVEALIPRVRVCGSQVPGPYLGALRQKPLVPSTLVKKSPVPHAHPHESQWIAGLMNRANGLRTPRNVAPYWRANQEGSEEARVGQKG